MKSVLDDDWVLYSLERKLVEGSYFVSILSIRDVVFRLSSEWIMILIG